MTSEELANELAEQFLIRDYQWNFSDGAHVPNAQDFLESFRALRNTTPPGHFQVAGRLVAVNSDGHFDIYMHIGEIDDEENG